MGFEPGSVDASSAAPPPECRPLNPLGGGVPLDCSAVLLSLSGNTHTEGRGLVLGLAVNGGVPAIGGSWVASHMSLTHRVRPRVRGDPERPGLNLALLWLAMTSSQPLNAPNPC